MAGEKATFPPVIVITRGEILLAGTGPYATGIRLPLTPSVAQYLADKGLGITADADTKARIRTILEA